MAAQRETLLAAEKLASLGALTAGVAHEVNNPTHIIRLNVGAISSAVRDLQAATEDGTVVDEALGLGRRIEAAASEVRMAAGRIEAIVGDLKSYVGAGAARVDAEVDLNAVVDSVLRLSDSLVRRHTRRLEVNLGQELPSFRGDFGRMQQVILNLVENACQGLTDTCQAVRLRTQTVSGGTWVEILVADEGRGIPADVVGSVTEPMFTTRRGEGGTGLGLSIVSAIVKEHGGELVIESAEGQGTRVTVRLPGLRKARPPSTISTG